MPTRILTLKEAVARRKANPGSAWPSRGEDNRLEPDCWPLIRPGFKVRPGARVFAIGSCFARNVERHLASMGFDVPTVSAVARNDEVFAAHGSEMLNKYTPTSIVQELRWTKTILDRDDTVTADDVLPLLLDLGGGRYVDLHTRINPGLGSSLEQQLERRRLIYGLTRNAFDCDLAVITLGLIETWWDIKTRQTIEFSAQLLRHDKADHYGFRRLTYGEAYGAVEQAVDLLLENNTTHVLITTSPVPLSSTFTDDDVIVANTYSKSLLRTVAGDIADRFDRVDYFPSYESVMLTRRNDVWTNDLIHVESRFIGHVMARVVAEYVEGGADTEHYDRMLRFADLVAQEAWAAAEGLYEQLQDADVSTIPPETRLDLAEYELAINGGSARRWLISAEETSEAHIAYGPVHFFRCARLYQRLGDTGAVQRAREIGADLLRTNPVLMRSTVAQLVRLGWKDEADWLMTRAEQIMATSPEVLHYLAKVRAEEGNQAEYDRLRSAALLLDDTASAHMAYSKELGERGDSQGALRVLIRFDARVRDPNVLRRIVGLGRRDGLLIDLADALAHRLTDDPDNVVLLDYLADTLARAGRNQEAVEIASRAAALGHDAPDFVKLMRKLRAAQA